MPTSEDRIKELHRRMDAMEQADNRRRYKIISTVAFAACFALTVVLALIFAQLPVSGAAPVTDSATASIFADNEALGYIVIAILAFCLGAIATIFCYRIKKRR
ncbi:MAG: DUF4179 domain-containing protein [Lachnospiraceae bacterium]|nr:DUF4179 domain-containing protein [Lachnospiraceae bacterium]